MHDETTHAGKKRSLEGAELVLDMTAKEPIITEKLVLGPRECKD